MSIKDDYHGTTVSDPYRWLEDPDSPETKSFVEAQNQLTFKAFEQCNILGRFKKKLTRTFDYPKYGCPFKRGDLYFYYFNSGLQAQHVLYVQKTLDAEAKVLLDPNTLSSDGTVALSQVTFSPNGKYLAHSLSKGGSDWVTIK
eukprot:gene20229-24218_t